MYVNINRYLKIYLSNPPYTYIGPRANTWELTIDKIDKFEPRNVNDCKIPLILFMFFETFSAFLCYRRKFSVFLQTIILLHNSKVFKLLNNYPPPVVRFVEVFYARPTVLFKLERLWSLMQNKGVTLQDFEKRALFVSK